MAGARAQTSSRATRARRSSRAPASTYAFGGLVIAVELAWIFALAWLVLAFTR